MHLTSPHFSVWFVWVTVVCLFIPWWGIFGFSGLVGVMNGAAVDSSVHVLCSYSCVCAHSVMSDSANPWTVAHQAPLCLGFPRQEYWSGLPFSFPGDCPDPGIKPASPALAGGFFTTEPPGKPRSHSPWGKYLEVEFPNHRMGVGLTRRKCQTTFQSGCCVGYFLKFMKVTGDLASL